MSPANLTLKDAAIRHSVANAIVIVESLAKQTAEQASNLPDFLDAFLPRHRALWTAQMQLLGFVETDFGLRTLLESQLAAFCSPRLQRVKFFGPDVKLNHEEWSAFTFVFNELTLNSGKYGALSSLSGFVQICWHLKNDGVLFIDWIESGGPPVSPPTRRGDGSDVIARYVRALGGTSQLQFAPEGLKAHFVIQRLSRSP